MDINANNEKQQDFLEILNKEHSYNAEIDQKILFITTDCWLAQLGSRKNN